MFGSRCFFFLSVVESDTTSAAWSMPVYAGDQFFAGMMRAAGFGFAGVR